MRDRLSKQRRATAQRVAELLLDPEFRRDRPQSPSGEYPIVIALWDDPLSKVLPLIDGAGCSARVCVSTPGGRGFFRIDMEDLATAERVDESTDSDDVIRAAPVSTIGMLAEATASGKTFNLVVAEPETSRTYSFAVASSEVVEV